MEISIRPYNSGYREGAVKVLESLWHFSEKERYLRFDWLYDSNTNPSFHETLAVVAVDENNEVMGFRGWVPGIIWQDGRKYIVARAADVVVSPKARRQGVFSKMTTYSISYLKEKGIDAILNLSSNSQSNPGYQKLGWLPISNINIWYKPLLLHHYKPLNSEIKKEYKENILEILPYIPQGLVIPSSESLCFSMKEGQLDWYSQRPNKKYIAALSRDKKGQLTSLFIFDCHKNKSSLVFHYFRDILIARRTFRMAIRYINSKFIAVWGWALSKENIRLLHQIGFIKIPLYERIMKKPPLLARCIEDVENKQGWQIGKKDFRDIHNWEISLLDDF